MVVVAFGLTPFMCALETHSCHFCTVLVAVIICGVCVVEWWWWSNPNPFYVVFFFWYWLVFGWKPHTRWWQNCRQRVLTVDHVVCIILVGTFVVA